MAFPQSQPIPVAMVQRKLAHYRQPIYQLLSADPDLQVTFFAAPADTYTRLKTIDPALAELPVTAGGLRWHFLRDWHWGPFCWQFGLLANRRFRQQPVRVYEGTVYFLSTWVSALWSRLTGRRVIFWTHGFVRDETGAKNWLRIAFYSLAHGLLVYHHRSRDLLIARGFNPQRIHVIYNSLDYDRQTALYRELTPATAVATRLALFPIADRPLLVFIGRLTPMKKLDQLLAAVEHLNAAGHPCHVLFVGDGPERDHLQTQAAARDLTEQVHFYGPCYDETQIARFLYAADLCIAPGEVGLTAIHALSYGTPVITHDQPDDQMPEYEAITPGVTGAFFKRDCSRDLADQILNWLNNQTDRDAVRAACRRVVDQCYNPHEQLAVFKRAVQQVLAESP